MRQPARLLLTAAAAVGLCGTAAATPAVAAEDGVVSQPNGDFSLDLRLGSTTDKDRDGNSDTATSPDKLITLYTLCGRIFEGSEPGVVTLTITVDAPGEASDEQLTRVGDLERYSCMNLWLDDKVEAGWPAGAYTVTIDADNGRDVATVTGGIAIH